MQKSAEMLRGYVRDIINCSFVAKLSWKKNIFFEKIFVFFTKYTLFAEKKCFYLEKKNFYREKYKWKCKRKKIISEIYFYTENVCATNKI